MWFVPIVIYYGLKSIIKLVNDCQNENQSTSVTEIQQRSGFCLVGIEHGKPDPMFMHLERSENFMENFFEALEETAH